MAARKKAPEEASFEEALAHLEDLVGSMEDGSISLSELVSKYEEGSRYLRVCQKRLLDAELKIEKLKQEQASWSTVPFDPETHASQD